MSFSLSRSRVGTDSHIAAKLKEAFGAYDRDGRGTMLGTQIADFDRRAFPAGHASAKRRIAKYGHEGSMSEVTLDEFIAVEQPDIASLYADRKDEAIRLLKQIIADVRDQKAYTSSLRRQRSLTKLQARIGSLPKLRSVERHPGDKETDSPSIGDPQQQLISLFHRNSTDSTADPPGLDAFSIITGKRAEGEYSLTSSPQRYSVASQSARGSMTDKRMSTRSRIQTVTANSLDDPAPPANRISPGFNIESPNGPSAQSARTSIVSVNTATTVALCDDSNGPHGSVQLDRVATSTVSNMDGSLSLENPSLLKAVGPEQSSTALTSGKDTPVERPSESACCVIL